MINCTSYNFNCGLKVSGNSNLKNMEYKDPILSQFKDKERINAEIITGLIDSAKRERSEEDFNISQDLHDKTLQKCKECVSIYTDLVKLNFLLAKSWDLKTLKQSVMLRFGLQEIASLEVSTGGTSDEEFCKDIALKTIRKCDKLSLALDQLTSDMAEIMKFLKSTIETNNSVRVLFNDAMTLLLEIWFVCGQQLKKLKRQVASFFMRSKLLLIDYELEQIQSASLGKLGATDLKSLQKTVLSYKSFIKVLIQQLNDAEKMEDLSEFEECLAIFLDVEGMYQAFNFTWLLQENNILLSQKEHEDWAKQESDKHDFEDLVQINEFLDNSLVNEEEEDNFSSDNQQKDILNAKDDMKAETSYKSPKPSEQEEAVDRSRRLSGMSDASDLSIMMEKTSLRKELPHLLQAFHNVKKLANELETVRESGVSTPPISSPIGSPNSWSLDQMGASPSPSSSILLSKSANLGSSKILEAFAQRHSEFSSLSNGPLTQSPLSKLENSQHLIRQDMLKLMAQTPEAMKKPSIQTNVPGFGSNILNNLYGIGSRK